jgi:hypothetical protein
VINGYNGMKLGEAVPKTGVLEQPQAPVLKIF